MTPNAAAASIAVASLLGLALLIYGAARLLVEDHLPRRRSPQFRVPDGSEDLHVEIEDEPRRVRRIWAELEDGGVVTLWERQR